MEKIELLAPAGNIESLYAAVQAGANAVYLGGNKFSARAYASNFDDEGMTKATEYCHLYGVEIYVTINTLMKESELKEALEYSKFLYSIGVDALIIQDLGLANLIRRTLPDFELHASTQMTIHNAEGALFLRDLGFKRIVLSRELSLEEIEHISKELGIETEIFVHGALCVCYSGQCLMSSMIGGRSGNRGRCAQSCRLPYTIINKKNGEEQKGYILSPKDTCTIENIKEIIESGTASLKIEGRMKRPEYVAGVVQSYRKAIDEVLRQQNYIEEGKRENYINKQRYDKFKDSFNVEEEKKKLMQLFNREGFSRAYLFGNVGKDMMAYSFPKNTGVLLGKVDKDLTVVLKDSIGLKDGVRNGEEGFTVSRIIKNGIEVEEACSGDRVKIVPSDYKKGDILYKTSDVKLLKKLEQFHKNPYEKKLTLKLQVKFKVNEPISLYTEYKDRSFEVKGETVQKALKKPLDKERIVESLSKTGDIPFKFSNVDFIGFDEGFLPVSAINEVRRNLFSQIERYILNKNSKRVTLNDTGAESQVHIAGNPFNIELPETIIFLSNEEQLKAFLEYNFQCVAINPFENLDFKYLDKLRDKKVFLRIPNIVRREFDYICGSVKERLKNIEGIITANLGLINEFQGKTNIIGDYKLNIFNSCALDFYKKFISGSCLSVELNKKELREVCKNIQIPVQALIYGKIEVMVSEYCAIGSVFGGKTSCGNCNRVCDRGEFTLKDRKNEEFILKTDKFCRNYIYNSVPINLISNIDELKAINIKSYRLDFIDEGYFETKKILKALKNGRWEDNLEGFTRGHYKRGVE